MNHIFLIGNGFDLAHGLKTSYADFILGLLNKQLSENSFRTAVIEEKYFNFKNPLGYRFSKFESYDDFVSQCSNSGSAYTPIGKLIRGVFEDIHKKKWVDIESYFFNLLKRQYIQNTTTHAKVSESDAGITSLNNELRYLKKELIEYLTGIEKEVCIIPEIQQILNQHPAGEYTKKLILNFNYTDTVKAYEGHGAQVVNIHGSLEDPIDDIIFGYGDEMEPTYAEIEMLDKNSYLENFKSFYYLKNDKYQLVNSFIRGHDNYHVHILGHSCGISDRILLNSIFEKRACKKIYTYYHDKGNSNDYFEKSINISRHFSASAKQDFRLKVVSEKSCKPLVSFENQK